MKLFKLIPNDNIKNGLKVIGLSVLAIIITYLRFLIFPWKSQYFAIGIYLLSGVFILIGIVLILLEIIPKIHEKYFPESFNNSQNKYRRRRTKAK